MVFECLNGILHMLFQCLIENYWFKIQIKYRKIESNSSWNWDSNLIEDKCYHKLQ